MLKTSIALFFSSMLFLQGDLATAYDITDISDELRSDATIAELADSYTVIKVRDAIADCQRGEFVKAAPVLLEYAQSGDVGATYVLARMYVHGSGIEKSLEKADKLFESNSEKGHAPSMFQLATLKEATAPAEAFYFYKMAAANDLTQADIKLGQIAEQGLLGRKENPKLAFSHYEKAHEAGNPFGTFFLARCMDSGTGTSSNAQEATRMYRSAALSGVAVASTVMASRYFRGTGIERDPVAAIGWLTKGAQQGSTEAMVLLGQRYENGDVLRQDLNRAGQLYSQAASKRDPAGLFSLAMLYLEGKGTKKDVVRAYVLLEDAQVLPKAKALFKKVGDSLTKAQLALAKKKIAEAAARQ